jgi:hypothetical protein
MGYKTKVGILGTTSAIIWTIAWVVDEVSPDFFAVPIKYDSLILEPIFMFFGALSLSLLVLYFLPKMVYDMWWKFARIYIPICLLLFVWLADSGGGFGMPSLTPPEGMAMFFSALYLFITFGIIIAGFVRAKR